MCTDTMACGRGIRCQRTLSAITHTLPIKPRLPPAPPHARTLPQVKVGVDIVVRGARSLMEAMTRFVSDWRVDLVVVPSTCLNRSSVHSGAILGSVALSILKRMEVPVLVATSKAGAAADVMFGRKRLRAMLLAEAWAMPMLDFMCERVLVQGRGDKLLLGQVRPYGALGQIDAGETEGPGEYQGHSSTAQIGVLTKRRRT